MMCRRLSAASESEGAHIFARIQIRFIRRESLPQLADNTWTSDHVVDPLRS